MNELRETIRVMIANHAVALPLIVAGYSGVVYEFLRPGKAWPGSAGAAILVLGAWGLVNAPGFKRLPLPLLLAITCAMLAVTAWLGYIAWRAWLNKSIT